MVEPVDELLARWRVHSTDLIEGGVTEVIAATRDTVDASPDFSSHIVARMRALVAEQVFPACLEWLQREGVSAAPGTHSAADEAVRQSVQRSLSFPENLLLAASAARRQYPGTVAALYENFRSLCRFLFLTLRMPGSRAAKLERCAPSRRAPYPDEDVDFIASCVRSQLRYNSDLVLLSCLTHPSLRESAAETPAGKNTAAGDETGAIFEAIHLVAQALRRQPVDSQELQDVAEELVQRFQDEGFQWEVVEEGAPYHEAMRHRFDTFGHIEPDQPVKTIKAALLRSGVTKHKGVIRRIRRPHGDEQ